VCSRGGNAVAWGRGSVRAGGCGRVDGVARRVKDRAGGSRVVRDRCLNFLRAVAAAEGQDYSLGTRVKNVGREVLARAFAWCEVFVGGAAG